MVQIEKAHENIRFRIYFLSIVFCFWFSSYIYVPAFGIYLDLLHFGFYATGLIMGSYGIMQIFLRFPLGIAADKFKIGGKLLVACGFIAAILSNLLLAVSSQFVPIFIGRFLAGITAALWVIITIWYGSSFDKNQSLKAMGHLQSTTVTSQLISMALCGSIVSSIGYASLFWIGSVFALLGLVLVILLPGTSSIIQNGASGDRQSVIQIVKVRKLWLLSILSLLSHAALFATIFGFSPVYFNSLIGKPSAIILLIIAFMLPHTIAPMLLSTRKSAVKNPFLFISICFVIAACTLFILRFTSNWQIYCFLHAVFGFFLGFVFPILLDQVYKIGDFKSSKTVMGFYQSVYSLGIVGGPIAAGFIAKQMDIRYVFMMSAAFLISAGIVSFLESLKWRNTRF